MRSGLATELESQATQALDDITSLRSRGIFTGAIELEGEDGIVTKCSFTFCGRLVAQNTL